MNETITALIELQTIDDEIRGHALARNELSENLDRLRSILNGMGGELDEKREKLAEATRFYDEKRVDLKGDNERMAVAKTKLAGVTRTKEYAAMQRELDNLRKKYSEDETELKRLSEAMEEYKTSIAGQESKLGELQAEVKREESASTDRLTKLDAIISKIETKKLKVGKKLSVALVNRYTRILSRREGKAVVQAVGGRCVGCQMMVPPQTYILIQRGETLQSCSNCQRYLYFIPAPVEDAATA